MPSVRERERRRLAGRYVQRRHSRGREQLAWGTAPGALLQRLGWVGRVECRQQRLHRESGAGAGLQPGRLALRDAERLRAQTIVQLAAALDHGVAECHAAGRVRHRPRKTRVDTRAVVA